MNKIGIITMCYNSTNYGGVLQAFALEKYISSLGYSCEQIMYNREQSYSIKKKIKLSILNTWHILSNITLYCGNIKNCFEIKKKKKSFRSFISNKICHSDRVYNKYNIHESLDIYDCYIAGSDQIWRTYNPVFFLDFVDKDKRKCSYAASIGYSEIDNTLVERLTSSLSTYYRISMREYENCELLKKHISKDIRYVCDPTFLLSIQEWDRVCNSRKIIDRYIFCYFLGNNEKLSKIAEEYACYRGLKIVTINCLNNQIGKNDLSFGDVRVNDASPQDFLSLIKYAETVLTDSFHASVFSIIFGTNFFTFNRSNRNGMSTRMKSLFDLISYDSHYCDAEYKCNVGYMFEIEKSDISVDICSLQEQINESKEFIAEMLR